MLKAKAWVSTCWGPFEDLSLQFLKSLLSAFSADANRSCGQGLSLKRSFTSCSEAQFKPRGFPSLIWSSVMPIKWQITKNHTVQILSCSSLLLFDHRDVENRWEKKLLPKPVGITAKTSLPSSKQFTGIFCFSFSSKLKSELIKSSRNAPWAKSTDSLHDVKCTELALVSVTCQFKPIRSLRLSANAGK